MVFPDDHTGPDVASKVDEAASGLVLRVKLREPIFKAQAVRFYFFRDHGVRFVLELQKF